MEVNDDIQILLLNVLSGNADEAEMSHFRAWYECSEDNKALFREYEKLWLRGRYALSWNDTNIDEVWHEVERRRLRIARRRLWLRGASIAAILLVFLGVGILLRRDFNDNGADDGAAILGQKPVLVLSDGVCVALDSLKSDSLNDGTSVIGNGDGVLSYNRSGNVSDSVRYNVLNIPMGGEYQLRLSDGTLVYLNSESSLKYPVSFGNENRTVELSGEAYFVVTSDMNRPFIVVSDKVRTMVLGTEFNVSAFDDEDNIEVSLVKGSVNVSDGDKSINIVPNEQFRFNKLNGVAQVRNVNANMVSEWRDGILNFSSMKLSELCSKLHRWYGVDFVFASDGIKDLLFSGALRKYDDVAYNMSLICQTVDASFNIDGHTVVLSKK